MYSKSEWIKKVSDTIVYYWGEESRKEAIRRAENLLYGYDENELIGDDPVSQAILIMEGWKIDYGT